MCGAPTRAHGQCPVASPLVSSDRNNTTRTTAPSSSATTTTPPSSAQEPTPAATSQDAPRLKAVSTPPAATPVQRPAAEPSDSREPEEFIAAVESMHQATLRSEISLSTTTPPQRLAAYSHAIALEVERPETDVVPVTSEGDAFGRLILLYDPKGDDAWSQNYRLVAYIQADLEHDVAADPLLPEVSWEWLTEALSNCNADYAQLSGTVTSTASARFGDLSGVPTTYQLELRASWTPQSPSLTSHVEAFSALLASVAGLPPEGVASITRRPR